MALHFLVSSPLTAETGDTVLLTGAEAHHAAVVRRVRSGETVTVGDGAGVWLTGTCEEVSPREVTVRVETRTVTPAPRPRIELVQALAKGDRDELAVQAATELGIDGITPWQASRSVVRWDSAKAAKGLARWESIGREAAKQAHRAWLPVVSPVADLSTLCARAKQALVLVLEPTASDRLTDLEWSRDDARDVVLVVGPEGGIAPEERTALVAAGAREVRLGETVLRTSTAGPAALALVNARVGRW